MVNAGKFPTKLPCTASHEGTGTVAAVGSEVKNFKIGDRVMAGLPKNPCGKCFNCKGPNDWAPFCEHIEGHIGVFVEGAFAEYLVVDVRMSAHIPASMSFKSAAPLACAGCTIYRAIIVSEVKKGGWLAIVGSGGGLGHLGLQMGKAKGINVIGVDARDEGIELSKTVGCEHVLDGRKGKEAVVKEVQALTGGLGVEAAINTSEHETAAPLSCAITRMHGRMVQVAQPDMVCVPFPELIFRDIRIVGTLISVQEQAQDMLNLVAENKICVEMNVVLRSEGSAEDGRPITLWKNERQGRLRGRRESDRRRTGESDELGCAYAR